MRAIKGGSDPIIDIVLGKDPPPPGLGPVQDRSDGSSPTSHPRHQLGSFPWTWRGKSSVREKLSDSWGQFHPYFLCHKLFIYLVRANGLIISFCVQLAWSRHHWNIWKDSFCFLYKLDWSLTEAEIKPEISSKESLWHFEEVTLMKYELK